MEKKNKFKSSSNYKTTNGKCEVLQIAVAAIQLQQKAYNKFGAKPKLGRRRGRRRRKNFSSKLQDTAWKKKFELWTCCCCCWTLAKCKPSSHNFTLCIFVVPPSLTPFLAVFC
jgi:hypothetical protein